MCISHRILGFGVGRRSSSPANNKVLAEQGVEPRYFNSQLRFLQYIAIGCPYAVEYIKRSLGESSDVGRSQCAQETE